MHIRAPLGAFVLRRERKGWDGDRIEFAVIIIPYASAPLYNFAWSSAALTSKDVLANRLCLHATLELRPFSVNITYSKHHIHEALTSDCHDLDERLLRSRGRLTVT